ncbi:MAG: hypothetical protein ACKVE3_02420 [Dissulfuribacterales bacterium]
MCKGKVIGKLAAVLSIVMILASCSPVDKAIKEESATEVILINAEGGLTLLDAESGKRIPTCKEREGSEDECEAPAGFFANMCKDIVIGGSQIGLQETPDHKRQGDEQIRNIHLVLCGFKFEGSYCRTYVNRVTGEEFEICR